MKTCNGFWQHVGSPACCFFYYGAPTENDPVFSPARLYLTREGWLMERKKMLISGFFFTFMALGMAVSRLFSGRLVDRGMVTQVIEAGLYLVCFCFFGLSSCGWLTTWSLQWTTYFLFTIALLLGIGFGTMFPAYNTLFVNLAPNNQRGTATSTYLTSWDVGIGAGMLLGGYIAEIATFKMAYLFGAALTVISLFYFRSKVAPHFHRHKLR